MLMILRIHPRTALLRTAPVCRSSYSEANRLSGNQNTINNKEQCHVNVKTNVWRNLSCNLSFSLQTTFIARLLCNLCHEKETEEKVAVCLCETQDKNLKMLA